jgi:hypothetical protein
MVEISGGSVRIGPEFYAWQEVLKEYFYVCWSFGTLLIASYYCFVIWSLRMIWISLRRRFVSSKDTIDDPTCSLDLDENEFFRGATHGRGQNDNDDDHVFDDVNFEDLTVEPNRSNNDSDGAPGGDYTVQSVDNPMEISMHDDELDAVSVFSQPSSPGSIIQTQSSEPDCTELLSTMHVTKQDTDATSELQAFDRCAIASGLGESSKCMEANRKEAKIVNDFSFENDSFSDAMMNDSNSCPSNYVRKNLESSATVSASVNHASLPWSNTRPPRSRQYSLSSIMEETKNRQSLDGDINDPQPVNDCDHFEGGIDSLAMCLSVTSELAEREASRHESQLRLKNLPWSGISRIRDMGDRIVETERLTSAHFRPDFHASGPVQDDSHCVFNDRSTEGDDDECGDWEDLIPLDWSVTREDIHPLEFYGL